MDLICSIQGCNKPIVTENEGAEFYQCCEEHIEEIKKYYEERYNREQRELYEWWESVQ